MKKNLIITCMLLCCMNILSGCYGLWNDSDNKNTNDTIFMNTIYKDFGSYEIPNNWYEDITFVTGAFSYIKEGTIISEPFNSVTVLYGSNQYSIDEHELFREAILNQLVGQVADVEDVEILGEGIVTSQGYYCYIFELRYNSGEFQKFAYIVGEKKYCQVDEMNQGTGEESGDVFQSVVDSFIWNE